MTLWQDPPPQTRRQARESERAAQLKAENAGRSRRAATNAPTAAGEIPEVSTPFDSEKPSTDAGVDTGTVDAPPDLFHSAAKPSQAQPVTVPVTVVAPPAPVRKPAPMPATPERALTRRELRAMLQAEEANGQAAATQPANDAAPTAAAASAPIISISSLPLPSATPQAHSTSPARESADAEAQDLIVKQTPASDALILPDATSSSPRSYQPPTDRWTPADPHDNGTDPRSPAPSFSRSTVSSGSATTSNALIIPNVPSVADAMGPLTSTGEILVTGSIDLPRSLGATGQRSDRFDSSDIDRLFEQPEAGEQTESTVAPIRASRAVSTHTSTRDVITPRRTYGNKLPTVLAITAAVLALGVVGLLVAGYILKVF